MKQKKGIKFYLDKSVNKNKKDKIIKFLKECKEVQNQLYQYYWEDSNFIKSIINSKNKLDFNRKIIDYRTLNPQLKSHHFQQVSQQVFGNLKSIETDIINDKLYFRFDDKEKQAIYNYCSGFCFEWNWLKKFNNKQLNKYKDKNNYYYDFLLKIQNYINNEDLFQELKQNIEDKFWEIKDKQKCPVRKELEIMCNSAHTLDIELKEFQWVFTIDNNDRIGGSEKRGVYDKLTIPVKFVNYHKQILKDKQLANSFILKLNRHNNIEIIGVYEVEVDYPKPKPNAELVGIDIGLKKLIASSDGEFIEQNPKIVKKLEKVVNKQSNRNHLKRHLQEKFEDDTFELSNNRYLLQQVKLTDFVKCDNRYKIKQFLKGRQDNHIVMEDLKIHDPSTYSRKANNMIRRLHIQGIKNDILKYSKVQGIQVTLINPAFTSQQCPVCGHISKENRKTQEKFCCVKCGHTDNADFNASINIRDRIYNKEVKLNTPFWMIKEILLNT